MPEAGGRRWWALGAVMLAVLAVGLDVTVLSVALPTLAGALRAPESDLQWFSSGYALVLAAAMLPAGLLGDRYGRKKVMLARWRCSPGGSLACAYSRSAGRVHRGPGRARLGRRRRHRHGDLRSGGAVLRGGAAAGRGHLGGRQYARLPDRANPRRFLAVPLLVGLGVPDERSRRGSRLRRRRGSGPRVVLGAAPGVDIVGIVSSSAGLAALTYGFIEAGQHGWASALPVAAIVLGVVVLVAFFAWERVLDRRPAGEPLVDLSLFRSPPFTWGVILFAVLTLALVGLLFTMPQYFQGVMGTSAEGSGIRLLPVVGGLIVGLLPAARIAKRIGAKLAVATGFAVVAVALGLGATTTVSSGEGFAALWMAMVGVGTGITMATSASAALGELSEERAGVGSGVLQALKNTGAPLGTAILGSALASAYVSHLHLRGLAPAAAHTIRQSVFGGVAVAKQLRSGVLLSSVPRSLRARHGCCSRGVRRLRRGRPGTDGGLSPVTRQSPGRVERTPARR